MNVCACEFFANWKMRRLLRRPGPQGARVQGLEGLKKWYPKMGPRYGKCKLSHPFFGWGWFSSTKMDGQKRVGALISLLEDLEGARSRT